MTHQEAIDEIMDYFDFGKVEQVMVALNWRWVNGIPSQADLRRQARTLLRRTLDEVSANSHEYFLTATGGLSATYEQGVLALNFSVASWDVDLKVEHDSVQSN